MSRRKLDAKTFAQQKRKRRQWITFMRMCRYGINNFSRNAWLTIAATAVMTITLLVVFVTLAARNVLLDTIEDIRNKVDMSIYVKTDTTENNVKAIEANLKKLSTVKSVMYISPEQAKQEFAESNKKDANTLTALNEADNVLPGTFRVKIADINDTSQLQHFTETDSIYKANANPDRPPSFAGQRKEAIQSIGSSVVFAQNAGLIASVVFVVISSLIIFNTIRMAIFNRRDEIQMMKLIGADRSFIRGPFVVEAIMYGFIAAIAATALGMALLLATQGRLVQAGAAMKGTIDLVTTYLPFVLLAMILLGAIIGIISSLLATRRYLKI